MTRFLLTDGAPSAAAGIATVMAFALAATFVVAALVKLAAPSTTATQFTGLGLPAPRLLARIVPPVELLVAAALVGAPRAGAIGALALLIGFTAVLLLALNAGRTVACGCFGSLGREPVSAVTIARNAVLMAMAVAATATTRPVMPDLASCVAASALVLLAALAVQLLALRLQIGRFWSVELAGEPTSDDSKGNR